MAKKRTWVSEACKRRIDEIGNMAEALDGDALREAVKDGIGNPTKKSRLSQATLEYAINGMLSGAMTPIANAISIAIQQMTQPTLVAIGALTDAVGLTKGNRALRDAAAMLEGVMEGFKADVYFFNKGFFEGQPLDAQQSFAHFAASRGMSADEARRAIVDTIANRRIDEMQRQQGRNFTEQEIADIKADPEFKIDNKFDEKLFEEFYKEEYDYVRHAIRGKTGQFVRVPTKITVGIDEYGKARFRRMKIAQMASIKAREDEAKGLGNYRELFKKYQKESLGGLQKSNDAREELLALEKRMGKVFGGSEEDFVPYNTMKEFTLANTFQSPLVGAARDVQRLQKKHTFLNYMVPFIKTPWNILKEGVSYTPGLGVAMRSSYLKTDKNGNVVIEKLSKDELIPRQMLGLSMFAGVYAMFESGMITGAPKDGKEAMEWRAKGIQPFSVKIGDTWVPYQRIEPLATPLGLAADMFRAGDDYLSDPNPDKEAGQVLLDLMVGLKSHVTSKSFMEGFSTLIGMVSDPTRAHEKFVSGLINPLVPAAANMGARLADPNERIATGPLEALQRRVPLLRNELAADYDPLDPEGRKTQRQAAVTGFPVTNEADRSPLQVEAQRVGADVGRITDKLKGIDLTGEQTSQLRQMYAQMLTPRLQSLINAPGYARMSKARQKVEIERRASKIRAAVRKRFAGQLMRTDPDIARRIMNIQLEKKGLPERMK